MKRLRRRLFLHFSLQFIFLAIGIVILFLFILLITIMLMTRHESKYNYYQTRIDTIAMETSDSFKQLEMNDEWDKGFEKDQIWVQVINEDGTVVESSNVPNDLPSKYSPYLLSLMKEKNELQGYSLYFYLETTYEEPYLFVLGHKNVAQTTLKQIVTDFSSEGMIPEGSRSSVEDILKDLHGGLQIYHPNGETVQLLGENLAKDEKPLDFFMRESIPDTYATSSATYMDPHTNHLWVLYTENTNNKEIKLNSLKEVILAFAIAVGILLVFTIGLSFWNGFRYGNPLFIFTGWLSRMGNEQYGEVLTEKEKKLIFRKNGKVRLKYRLYSEVFQAFYTMAEKLDATNKDRIKLEQSREEWMTGISHDLRTPLTTMQGYGTLLESGQYDWSKDELEDIGRTIGEKSQYMLNLIEDFSLSFHLKNDTSQSFEPTELNFFISKIVEKFTNDRTLGEYPITFHSSNYPITIPIAKRWFERMMDNLIYNAVKHNPPGTEIKITIEKKDSGISIIVRDHGIGMDEETIANLFNRYFRGTNTEERVEGSGLGMSIAKQIAQLHKGDIVVRSKIGDGTAVTIQLTV
jgi:signal transduction histidine kinase/Na+-transporting methylmalonyl-CoA/oxaloacetate decarboxylase gamma subunit